MLSSYTDEELQEELERRSRAKDLKYLEGAKFKIRLTMEVELDRNNLWPVPPFGPRCPSGNAITDAVTCVEEGICHYGVGGWLSEWNLEGDCKVHVALVDGHQTWVAVDLPDLP